MYEDKPSILKYFYDHEIEVFIPTSNGKPLLGPIMFVRCTEYAIIKAKSDWFEQLVVYRDPERKNPQPIPIDEMDNFRRVLNLRDQEFYPLEIHDKKFLVGQKVRVLEGPLKDAVGVIKRIKGDRRLIVSVSGIAAVATSFVHPEFLEKLD